jgi:hypothetical protein
VEAGTDRPSPSWGEGLFAGSSQVVDTDDRCVVLVKCAVRRGRGLARWILGVGVELLFYF